MKKINGAELVRAYLGSSNVDALLECLGSKDRYQSGWETDILEIKGTYHPTPEYHDRDDKFPALFEWNVTHSMIALANANGGCVILGIAEEKYGKTLVRCDWDPDQILTMWQGQDLSRIPTGREYKDLVNHVRGVLLPKQSFLKGKTLSFCKNSGTCVREYEYFIPGTSVSLLSQLVEIYPCQSEQVGCPVLVIVVDPIPKGNELITVSRTVDGVCDKYVMYHRNTTADTVEITSPNEFSNYRAQRVPDRYDAPAENSSVPVDAGKIEDIVAQCMVRFCDRLGLVGKKEDLTVRNEKFKYTIFDLSSIDRQRKVLKELRGRRFEAVCGKSCGSVGFLEHPDFENGIFLHASVAGDIIEEGDRWSVTVGFRFNSKRNVWCYCAESATRLASETDENCSCSYLSQALESDETRCAVSEKLRGVRFSGVCDSVNEFHKFGFIVHRDFDTGIYLHSSEADQKLLYCGQKWNFSVVPRFNPKKRKWCYAAEKAFFEKHLLSEIAGDVERKCKLRDLSSVSFDAFCIEGNKTYGFLSHPSFEGTIYIDLPVTGGVEILTGSKWRFNVGARVIHPFGPWSYGAKHAVLILRAQYDEDMINDESMRFKIANELAGNLLNCTVGSILTGCAFLELPQFSNGVYYPKCSWCRPDLSVGDIVKVEIMPSYNKAKRRWCYEAKAFRGAYKEVTRD